MKTQAAAVVLERGDLETKVSVIVPLYNYENVIEEALLSVAEQTFKSLTLIVVDDFSTDDSFVIAEKWMRELDYPHLSLVLLRNSSNSGLSITRNNGLAHSRSEYCFFLDADNSLYENCIAKHVRALDNRRDCIGAYSIIEEFGEGSGLIGANVFDRERLKRGNYIDAMVMLRREALVCFEGFHPIKHGWEDYELWLRLCARNERLLHLPEVLSRYRKHSGSMLRLQTNLTQNISELHRNMEKLHPWIQLDAPSRQTRRPSELKRESYFEKVRRLKVVEPDKPIPPYKAYGNKILEKLDLLSKREALPVDVEIDTDYTGPAHGAPFDSFVTPRQREDSAKHTVRMLQLGIVAINPRPGVHAARDESGKFLRYRSLLASDALIDRHPASLLIHIHAFYPDVVEEILDYFSENALDGRFLVTTTTKKNRDLIRDIFDDRGFKASETILIENKGRDIGPFLDYVVDAAADDDVICHIHTKKSPDVADGYGEKWRKSLYGTLLTQTAIDAFEGDSRLGLLFPETSRSVGWGKNRSFCEAIATNFSRSLRPHPGPMPVGNMFFVRVGVARAMREATRGMPWPREPVPYDGTVLHAIERMWTIACEEAGYNWAAIHARYGDDADKGDRNNRP